MAKGRNFNDLRGGVDFGSRQVVSQWKGMLVVRSIPVFQSTEQWSTPWEVRKQAIFSTLSPRWFGVLTELQRAKWEANAKMLGSAYNQDKRLTTGRIGIIPRQGVLMGGCHLYTRSNMLAAMSDMNYPRDEAPLSTGLPPAPILEKAYLDKDEDGKTIIVCEVSPINLEMYLEKKLRIWLDVRSHGMIRKSAIEMLTDVTGPDTLKTAFAGFKAGRSWGNDWVSFNGISGGRAILQCDVVTGYSPKHGVVRSAGSAEGEVVIPAQEKNSPEAETLLLHIRGLQKRYRKNAYLRRKGFRMLADKLGRKLAAGDGDALESVLK